MVTTVLFEVVLRFDTARTEDTNKRFRIHVYFVLISFWLVTVLMVVC